MNSNAEKGKIITFYSYKGGTGRTMALANVATWLAKYEGKSVLVIDWDLEAPGLQSYFDILPKDFNKEGVIDFFCDIEKIDLDYEDFLVQNFEKYISRIKNIKNLEMMKAGVLESDYNYKVQSFNWQLFFQTHPSFFQKFIDFLQKKYEFVLIDSRTGLTDVGGICTMIMPEIIVTVFTPSNQSLNGILNTIDGWINYRMNSLDERPFMIFPLASRVDRDDDTLYQSWRVRYRKLIGLKFEEIYAPPYLDLDSYFDNTEILQSTQYTYGDTISVLEEGKEASEDLGSNVVRYKNIAEVLGSDINLWEASIFLSESYRIAKDRILKVIIDDLRTIDLSGLDLIILPNEISGLSDINEIDVSNNKLEDIGFLKYFPKIERIYLSNNNISDISVLSEFPQIKSLDLSNNNISKIDHLKILSNIEVLDLSFNKISIIPSWVSKSNLEITYGVQLEEKGKINFNGNPIETPPLDITLLGDIAIRRYFDELESEGKTFIREAKIMIVGEAKVGKTSLFTKLNNRYAELPKEEDRTRGIDIHRLTFNYRDNNSIITNIWDFGGQDILHATHRFFLTARSLYILLTATDTNDDNFDYWIPNIHLFGDESPILVVKNIKAGFNRNFSIRRFQNKGFNLPFPIIEVNLKTDEGFDFLEKVILEQIQQLPQFGQPLPSSWVRIRKVLQQKAEQQAYIPYETFKQLAKQGGIEEELKVQDVGRFLHEMGVILWYQQIPALKSKVILRPEWITNAVYQIVDDSNVGINRGYFNRKDVQRVWIAESYQNMHDELLALMQAFRLCYKKRGKEEYIIPSLLPADPEALNWNDNNNLKLQYQYDFMPKGIINQLTAQMHDLIRDEASVWSRGMVLQDNDTQALITQDYYKRKLTIQCEGSNARALMRMVMRDLDLVHEGYGGIAFKRRVPCTCSQCTTSNEPYIFEYEKLEKKLQEGKQRVPCFESEEFVSIQEILFNVGFQTINKRRDYDLKMRTLSDIETAIIAQKSDRVLNIFITYSKHDKSYLQDLRVSLRPFERREQIKVWYDGEIEAGAEWDADIKENLQKADIIILLVSRDFIKTDYIWDVEIKQAMERHEKGEAVVIPLIIRPCSWTGDATPFSKLNALPSKGKAISQWSDVDEAWLNVEQGLKKVIERRLK